MAGKSEKTVWSVPILICIALAPAVRIADGHSITKCQTPVPDSNGQFEVHCGNVIIARENVDRVIFNRIARRGGDGVDAWLTQNEWPLEFGQTMPVQPGFWMFVAWHNQEGPQSAAFPVQPADRENLTAQIRKARVIFVDAVKGRQELRQRIAHAGTAGHARRYLEMPFRIAGFHLGGGTYEFTILESAEGLDLLCVEDQAMFAPRRWWIIPAHVLPTDDKRSLGVIVYDDPDARERNVAEIRFPLKKILPIE